MEDKDIVVDGSSVDFYEDETFHPHNPLNRPEMHYTKAIIALSVFVVQFVALLLVGIWYIDAWWITTLILVGYTVAYGAVIAKRAVIWMVHLYQNKASDETRLKCVFEPSCSEYMILAVQKYGVIRGVYKGIRRLFRCGNESGVDYP